jgi:hypothetical protein
MTREDQAKSTAPSAAAGVGVVVLAQPAGAEDSGDPPGELVGLLAVAEPREAQPDQPGGVDPRRTAPVAPDPEEALVVGREGRLLVSFLLVAGAVPARAALPGANGLMVVQPPSGRGLLLVGADGTHVQQICTVKPGCDPAIDPMWSPDGSEIAFASPQGSGPSLIYPDGSWFACPAVASSYWNPVDQTLGPGFLPDGRLAVWVDTGYPPYRSWRRLTVTVSTFSRSRSLAPTGSSRRGRRPGKSPPSGLPNAGPRCLCSTPSSGRLVS